MDQQKPNNWDEFVDLAVDVFTRKDTDYESAFMRILLDRQVDGRSIWAWEVKKKLDRLRRWIKRGELQVKGEGVLDSVIDLVNYTVQYDLSGKRDPFEYLTPHRYRSYLDYLGASYIMRCVKDENWIGVRLLNMTDDVDQKVAALLLDYMGGTE